MQMSTAPGMNNGQRLFCKRSITVGVDVFDITQASEAMSVELSLYTEWTTLWNVLDSFIDCTCTSVIWCQRTRRLRVWCVEYGVSPGYSRASCLV